MSQSGKRSSAPPIPLLEDRVEASYLRLQEVFERGFLPADPASALAYAAALKEARADLTVESQALEIAYRKAGSNAQCSEAMRIRAKRTREIYEEIVSLNTVLAEMSLDGVSNADPADQASLAEFVGRPLTPQPNDPLLAFEPQGPSIPGAQNPGPVLPETPLGPELQGVPQLPLGHGPPSVSSRSGYTPLGPPPGPYGGPPPAPPASLSGYTPLGPPPGPFGGSPPAPPAPPLGYTPRCPHPGLYRGHLPAPSAPPVGDPTRAPFPGVYEPLHPVGSIHGGEVPHDAAARHSAGSSTESAALQHIIKAELMTTPSRRFKGDRQQYRFWSDSLRRRMEMVPSLDPLEVLQIIAIHVDEPVLKTVYQFINCAFDSESAVSVVSTLWETLDQRYGRTEMRERDLITSLKTMKPLSGTHDVTQLRSLIDSCRSVMTLLPRMYGLQYLNCMEGISELAKKLPSQWVSRWNRKVPKYNKIYGQYPNLGVFVSFLNELHDEATNPFASKEDTATTRPPRRHGSGSTTVLRTEGPTTTPERSCPIHPRFAHDLGGCRGFRAMDLSARRKVVQDNRLCYLCLGRHQVGACPSSNTCSVCKGRHHTLLHSPRPPEVHRGTAETTESTTPAAVAPEVALVPRTDLISPEENCMFSKTFAVHLKHRSSPKTVACLAILDEQSTRSFVISRVVNEFELDSPSVRYSIRTLSGLTADIDGRAVSGLKVKGTHTASKKWFNLPLLLTSALIPDTRHERATREIVERLPHIARLASCFGPDDPSVETWLLLGADCWQLMRSKSVGTGCPPAHRTPLGWALVGPVKRTDIPEHCHAKQAHGPHTLRSSIVECTLAESTTFLPRHEGWTPHNDIFEVRADDDSPTWSADNDLFVNILKRDTHVAENGQLCLPLPFKNPSCVLPDNSSVVYNQMKASLEKLKRHPDKLTMCRQAIQNYIDRDHVEIVPASQRVLPKDGKSWNIVVFPVPRPEKKDVRMVFNCRAPYRGTSLNDELLGGPDLNNPLRSVLLRFREFSVALSFDLKHMFNCFLVPEAQRDFLRFYWWEQNDPTRGIVPYRSKVHLFGACSSPAVAMFALKYIAEYELRSGSLTEEEAEFIRHSFYMDDGLDSFGHNESARLLLARLRAILLKYGLHVHKSYSNAPGVCDPEVQEAPTRVIPISSSATSKALGVSWDTQEDELIISLAVPDRPFTRRGLLSVTNTTFDPQGIAAPALLGARLIQREAFACTTSSEKVNYDEPLSEHLQEPWRQWLDGMRAQAHISVPRCLITSDSSNPELHVFADASKDAIGVAIYVRTRLPTGEFRVVLALGSSKLSPLKTLTIPRMELCAALAAVVAAEELLKDLRTHFWVIRYYTDSTIVLGYLRNRDRSFSKYVTRRVEAILQRAPEELWVYVPTESNPADLATRPISPAQLATSSWLRGPDFLRQSSTCDFAPPEQHTTLPETLTRAPRILRTATPAVDPLPLPGLEVVQRRSNWYQAVRILVIVLRYVRCLRRQAQLRKGQVSDLTDSNVQPVVAERLIFKQAQQQAFPDIRVTSTPAELRLPDNHPLVGLSPFVDHDGLLRVGGRLRQLSCPFQVKHPLILPYTGEVSSRFVERVHRLVAHQGILITHSRIRQLGVFIVKGKRLVSEIIRKCVLCQRLRGPTTNQLMADLPPARLEDCAPFEHIGVDVFGPFFVHDGKTTRRTCGTKKQFVLLLNCLASRAIHLEPLAGMDTASFLNALRRFFAIRGTAQTIRSDHGSNFVGALNQSADLEAVRRDLSSRGIRWEMNPVAASHYGGSYERKIGSVRRILEATIDQPQVSLSRDEFATLLQEAAAIVNSTPLYLAPDRASEPIALSPDNLLKLRVPSAPTSLESFSPEDLLAYGKRRWQRVQFLADRFWEVWRQTYLQDLSSRRKWCKVRRNIQSDDVVLIRDKGAPRCQWKLGIVQNPVPSADGLVRRVVVAHMDGHGKRKQSEKAVVDLVLLLPSDA